MPSSSPTVSSIHFRTEAARLRQAVADSALLIARELEAGRAISPFQEKLGQLRLPDSNPPVRAAILSTTPEHTHALLSDIVGHDYNVCKVVVPARLGYSEVLLQERGFLLDSGAGPKEFEDVGSFLHALEETHVLQGNGEAGLEPLRVKLKGPAHLSGLCLLVPHSLDALQRKPALLSTLADQADWVFFAGDSPSTVSPAHRQTIQLVLDHVTGLQNVLVENGPDSPGKTAGEEWWKGWKVTLSLGVVHQNTDLLRTRLGLLTAPESELRHYLVESRLLRQLETTLLLMEEEIQQASRALSNRLHLGREGLLPESGNSDSRKIAESIRTRLVDETESILRAAEREAKVALAPGGEINLQLRETAQHLSIDDIEQTHGEATIKLTLADQVTRRLSSLVTDVGRQRLATDLAQLREGAECSVRDAEAALEKATGLRHKINLELPDEDVLWETLAGGARAEIRYRGEMPRPTLGSRFQAARQGIMGLMILAMILGGVATLTGGDQSSGGDIRTVLYALMLPLLILGFLWTYVSFRKKERLTLEKEVEKLQDGVYNELRRAQQEFFREQHAALSTAAQRAMRAVQQQIDATMENLQRHRQRELEENRKRQGERQRTAEQRISRLRQFSQEIANLRGRLSAGDKARQQWLGAWIERFNKGLL